VLKKKEKIILDRKNFDRATTGGAVDDKNKPYDVDEMKKYFIDNKNPYDKKNIEEMKKYFMDKKKFKY